MSQPHARVFGVLLFVTLLVTAALSAAPATDIPAIGEPNVSASAIQWQVSVAYERLILTVAGPDGYAVSREFAAGRSAMLRVQELGSKGSADGQYTWELRVVPRVSAETRRQLAAAREAGDEQTIARLQAEAGLNRDFVRSGAFTIRGGSFVTPEPEEAAAAGGRTIEPNTLRPAPQDVVTADDEIIQGSLCVGLDCVNNESFGFDTIRLKENNTRIRFDDTSTSAGFPANDWQLTANDSASGGASKFSIDDTTGGKTPFTILAGAPTNSMFVGSSGKVGFRTSTPVLDLHISTTDTPAIRQEQTSAGGFTAQTWDIGANEANWFVRDVTGGSRLPLRIRPGAPTSSIDIAATGNVGVGTSSPANFRMDVLAGATEGMRVSVDGGATRPGLELNPTTLGYNRLLSYDRTAGTTMTLWVVHSSGGTFFASNGNVGFGVSAPTRPLEHANGAYLSAGGVWTNASSRDYKENICDLEADVARHTLEALKPVTYSYKTDPQEHHAGFIAEDAPDIVASKDHKGMSPMDVVAVLTRVVQEQDRVIAQLSQRIEQLEKDAQKSQK